MLPLLVAGTAAFHAGAVLPAPRVATYRSASIVAIDAQQISTIDTPTVALAISAAAGAAVYAFKQQGKDAVAPPPPPEGAAPAPSTVPAPPKVWPSKGGKAGPHRGVSVL